MILFYVVGQQRETAVPGLPQLTTGQFIAFNAAFGLFLAAMQALGDASLSLLRIVPIYERLMPILTQTPEVDRSKAHPGKLTGAIELSNVRFRYDADGPLIVNGRVADDRARRVRRVRRAVGLRQVDADAAHARLRAADQRIDLLRRPGPAVARRPRRSASRSAW